MNKIYRRTQNEKSSKQQTCPYTLICDRYNSCEMSLNDRILPHIVPRRQVIFKLTFIPLLLKAKKQTNINFSIYPNSSMSKKMKEKYLT